MPKRKGDFTTELFGEATCIFRPDDDPEEVQRVLDELWAKQETSQFGAERFAVYFMPGEYDERIELRVGFYTQAAGLGYLPTDTKLTKLSVDARWMGDAGNHIATCNFWRGVENLEFKEDALFAVSQATFLRRCRFDGALTLHDENGWASGGFLADSAIGGIIDSGSQQQWETRNCRFAGWRGENWNEVFTGDAPGSDPAGTWPKRAYTSVAKTPVIREKPFLIWEEGSGFAVCVPAPRRNCADISWQTALDSQGRNAADRTERLAAAGIERVVPIGDFYVAKPGQDDAKTLNAALAAGKGIFFTPGIYPLEESLRVSARDTVLLGSGLATLLSMRGNACVETADADGIVIAGLLFDAGPARCENLAVVGGAGGASHEADPISLSDVFFRVGGAAAHDTCVETCLTINACDVIGDNLWVWRADHGDGVAWEKNAAEQGMIVNGDRVTAYALMVEHFRRYQTVWNGEDGQVYMYQSELPYDVPEQNAWRSHGGAVNGYASFKVDDAVRRFAAWGLGIYSYHRDTAVEEFSAMEVPDREGVRVNNLITVMLTGNPGITHGINDQGEACNEPGATAKIMAYENGIREQ